MQTKSYPGKFLAEVISLGRRAASLWKAPAAKSGSNVTAISIVSTSIQAVSAKDESDHRCCRDRKTRT
jgi:hypothetical protein